MCADGIAEDTSVTRLPSLRASHSHWLRTERNILRTRTEAHKRQSAYAMSVSQDFIRSEIKRLGATREHFPEAPAGQYAYVACIDGTEYVVAEENNGVLTLV